MLQGCLNDFGNQVETLFSTSTLESGRRASDAARFCWAEVVHALLWDVGLPPEAIARFRHEIERCSDGLGKLPDDRSVQRFRERLDWYAKVMDAYYRNGICALTRSVDRALANLQATDS